MKIELRSDHALIEGYVTATARDSRVLPSPTGPFVEQVVPRTFDRALQHADNVELRYNHERPLGSIRDGNLSLCEDNIGLRATATVTDEEVIEKARAGELRGWSFGFYTIKDHHEPAGDNLQRRYLDEIDLVEVSILDKTPAYIATSIEQRDGESVMQERRVFDTQVEVSGLSDASAGVSTAQRQAVPTGLDRAAAARGQDMPADLDGAAGARDGETAVQERRVPDTCADSAGETAAQQWDAPDSCVGTSAAQAAQGAETEEQRADPIPDHALLDKEIELYTLGGIAES